MLFGLKTEKKGRPYFAHSSEATEYVGNDRHDWSVLSVGVTANYFSHTVLYSILKMLSVARNEFRVKIPGLTIGTDKWTTYQCSFPSLCFIYCIVSTASQRVKNGGAETNAAL